MNELLWLLIGVALGGGAAALLVARWRGAAARETAEALARAGAAETAAGTLREQLGQRDEALAELRAALAVAQESRVRAETQLEEARKSFEEQRRLLTEAENKLKETFAALAAETLKGNSEMFARQTEEKVKPLREALERYEKQIAEMEKSRQHAYASVSKQIEIVEQTSQQLRRETSTLVTALRAPQVRGRWGEVTLQRVVELAGLSEHADFNLQPSVTTEEGRLRPDLTVRLPGGRTVVVDAKVSLDAFLDAIEAPDEAGRTAALARHARQLRDHMRKLSEKSYWRQFDSTPDFVVMFVPGESFFSAALEQDRALIEDGAANRVVLATPTTLIALLRTVAYGWQQQTLVEKSQEIGATARTLFDRVCKFAEHFGRVGDSLRRAVGSYNDAVGSWEARVAPMGRRLPELGATPHDAEFADLPTVDAAARSLKPQSRLEAEAVGDGERAAGDGNDDDERAAQDTSAT